jgi:hypothetical protein
MRITPNGVIVFLVLLVSQPLSAQPEPNAFRVEGTAFFSMFQQQVKSEIGAERGERLVLETELGGMVSGTFGLLEFASAGVFVRAGFGTRENAQFAGFDAAGKTIVENRLGGSYSELWVGPLLHLHWKQFFLDGGYALYGRRIDDGRTDLPSTTGDTTSTFSTDPSFAWLLSLGGNLPVADDLSVIIKVDWCLRYYNQRGGEPLAGNINHGTQSLAPAIGIAWTP